MAIYSLVDAAESGDTSTLVALLAAGHDVDAHTANGETALMRAAANGHADTVRLLINGGADVNEKRDDGLTALIRASFSGHSDVVVHLLISGADVNTTDRCGMTAQEWALSKGHLEIASILANGRTASLDDLCNNQPDNSNFVSHEADAPPHESSTGKIESADSLNIVRASAIHTTAIKAEGELPLFSLPQGNLSYWRVTMMVSITLSVIGGVIYIYS